MSKITAKIVDSSTGQPLGYGVSAIIIKAGDKNHTQLGSGFITDDNGVLTIDSPLLDYTSNKDAVDIYIEPKGYQPALFSPDEFALGSLKMKKQTLLGKVKGKINDNLKKTPAWAWEMGAIAIGATFVIALILKRKK